VVVDRAAAAFPGLATSFSLNGLLGWLAFGQHGALAFEISHLPTSVPGWDTS
jgi:hypothetical protein